MGQAEMADRRLDQLADNLRTSVALVRQLDIDDGDAVEIFRKLLADSAKDEGKGK